VTTFNGEVILVLEDEFILAWEAEEILKEAGACVLGPAHNIAQALKLIEEASKIHAAVLDININGSESTPVAKELDKREVPYLFTTGYGVDTPRAGKALVLDKPYAASALIQSLSTMILRVT